MSYRVIQNLLFLTLVLLRRLNQGQSRVVVELRQVNSWRWVQERGRVHRLQRLNAHRVISSSFAALIIRELSRVRLQTLNTVRRVPPLLSTLFNINYCLDLLWQRSRSWCHLHHARPCLCRVHHLLQELLALLIVFLMRLSLLHQLLLSSFDLLLLEDFVKHV